MKILVIDTETTGLSPEENKLIEIAACTYDLSSNTILESYQTLLKSENNAAEEINHIPVSALTQMKEDQLDAARSNLYAMEDYCDFVVAHNAPFDRGFLEANEIGFVKPWVCSKADIEYPGNHSSRRLGHLCYDFDVPVLKAHSALHDVYILIELLKKIPDLEKQLLIAKEPKEKYMALVTFDNKDLAKSNGFRWNKSQRAWIKDLRVSQITELPFQVQKIVD